MTATVAKRTTNADITCRVFVLTRARLHLNWDSLFPWRWSILPGPLLWGWHSTIFILGSFGAWTPGILYDTWILKNLAYQIHTTMNFLHNQSAISDEVMKSLLSCVDLSWIYHSSTATVQSTIKLRLETSRSVLCEHCCTTMFAFWCSRSETHITATMSSRGNSAAVHNNSGNSASHGNSSKSSELVSLLATPSNCLSTQSLVISKGGEHIVTRLETWNTRCAISATHGNSSGDRHSAWRWCLKPCTEMCNGTHRSQPRSLMKW